MCSNRIKDLLVELDICNEASIEPYYPRVRDRDDISVLTCRESGVLFLSTSDHMDMTHYEEKEGFAYWSANDRKQAINMGYEDRVRRKNLLQYVVANRVWLDVGTGSGGILDELSPLASETYAIEPQRIARDSLSQLGYNVMPSIDNINDQSIDVVTLFHVFEHFTHPLDDLKTIYNKMKQNGRIYIEVPHARDFILSFLDHDSFKAFTFWSEHLILHTRESLTRFLDAAGFKDIVVSGCQRYPLANHLYWLAKNKPGGHMQWDFLRTMALDTAYSDMLNQLDKTDTLIVTATKK